MSVPFNLELLTTKSINLKQEYKYTKVKDAIEMMEKELVGLIPVKKRIRDIAALLIINQLRKNLNLISNNLGLHMCFTGSPGTGKTTIALRMADILYKLGYCRKGHLFTVAREDLVGQYIGHTAPKTKKALKKAIGGILFVDEAYSLYKPDNERDYGAEAIEILLQVMENQRDDIVVILAGYKERMENFFNSNSGFSSRIAHHVDFPDYSAEELLSIGKIMLEEKQFQLTPEAEKAFLDYIKKRKEEPSFANARSVKNLLNRTIIRQAKRYCKDPDKILTKVDLVTITAEDIKQSGSLVTL